MNLEQRKWLAGKLGDLGNLAVTVMLFGYVMAEKRPSILLPIIAWAIWTICHVIGFILLRKE